jgi:hypothetical protein
VVTLSLRSAVKVIRICGIAERRGSALEARQLYQDATPVRQAQAE